MEVQNLEARVIQISRDGAIDAPTRSDFMPHLCNKSLSLMTYVAFSPKARIYINAVLEGIKIKYR